VRRDPAFAPGVEGFFRLAQGAEYDRAVLEIGGRIAGGGAAESLRPGILRRLGHAHLRRGEVAAAIERLERADRISAGDGEPADLEKLRDISLAMQKASLCGLGQTAPNPVLSTLRYFEPEYRALIKTPASSGK